MSDTILDSRDFAKVPGTRRGTCPIPVYSERKSSIRPGSGTRPARDVPLKLAKSENATSDSVFSKTLGHHQSVHQGGSTSWVDDPRGGAGG